MKRPSTDILPPEIPNPFPNQFPTNNYILIRVLLQQDLLLGCTKQKSGLAKERVRFGIPLKFRNHNFLYNSSWTSPFKKYELYLTSRGQIVTLCLSAGVLLISKNVSRLPVDLGNGLQTYRPNPTQIGTSLISKNDHFFPIIANRLLDLETHGNSDRFANCTILKDFLRITSKQ